MKIVIIEDEPKTARNLAKTIQSVSPNAEILHVIESVAEGKAFLQNPPDIDLIFADIQLGDGTSFDIFDATNLQIPIIFCTSYNEYALQAFKTYGIDYILKPFSTPTIQQAMDKYSALFVKKNLAPTTQPTTAFADLIAAVVPPLAPKDTTILVFSANKITPVDAENIALLYIENLVVYALTTDGTKLSTNYTLSDLEQKLYPTFFRANRQFLIHKKAIKEASHSVNRHLQIHLTLPFSKTILVNKEKVTAFLKWLAA